MRLKMNLSYFNLENQITISSATAIAYHALQSVVFSASSTHFHLSPTSSPFTPLKRTLVLTLPATQSSYSCHLTVAASPPAVD